MIVFEGPRIISPFPSGLGVARPRSEPRLLCFLGVFCVLPCLLAGRTCSVRTVKPLSGGISTVAGVRAVPVFVTSVQSRLSRRFAGVDPGSSHSMVWRAGAWWASSDSCAVVRCGWRSDASRRQVVQLKLILGRRGPRGGGAAGRDPALAAGAPALLTHCRD